MSDKQLQTDSSRVFPLRWPVTHREDRPARIIGFTDEGANEVFEALSSETARALLQSLHDDPQTASDLAEQVGTSVQNVQYHLQKFSAAGLIQIVDTWYSSRGTEMKVYSPSNQSLVLYTGEAPGKKRLREALSRGAGAIALLGIVSVGLDFLIRALAPTDPTAVGEAGGDTGVPAGAPTVIELAGIAVTPGLLFFLGGLFLLALGTVWWFNN